MEELSHLIFVGIIIFVAPITLGFWLQWYINAIQIRPLAIAPQRQWLYYIPLLCLGAAILFARSWVHIHLLFLLIFLATVAFGLLLVNGVAYLLNMGAITEGIERRNPSAIWAVSGAWIGATLSITRVNLGTDTAASTVFVGSLLLGITTFISLWLLFSALTGNSVAIALDRDSPSGLRLAGLLVAWGLVIGNALPNTWISTEAAIAHFADHGWIVLLLLGIAIGLEQKLQPNKRQPFPPIKQAGTLPAVGYLAIAAAWLLFPSVGK